MASLNEICGKLLLGVQYVFIRSTASLKMFFVPINAQLFMPETHACNASVCRVGVYMKCCKCVFRRGAGGEGRVTNRVFLWGQDFHRESAAQR